MPANCLFSRDPERLFNIERPRNWGSFGAEFNGLKLWRRGGSDVFGRLESFWRAIGGSFLGGWLVVENASKLSFFSRDPERPFDIERPRNWGSFGAETQWVKAVAKGWVSDAFGRLQSFWRAVGGSFLGG